MLALIIGMVWGNYYISDMSTIETTLEIDLNLT